MYKDLVTYKQNDKTHLDVDVQSFGDRSMSVADLEDARRELIALSRVPAHAVGYGDNYELREQLIHTNVAFAIEISELQETFNRAFNKLIDIIATKSNFINQTVDLKGQPPSFYSTVSLVPPTVLTLQLIEMTLSSIGNIAAVFTNMGMKIDPFFFMKQYVPHIPWDKFENAMRAKELNDQTKAAVKAASGTPDDLGGGMY